MKTTILACLITAAAACGPVADVSLDPLDFADDPSENADVPLRPLPGFERMWNSMPRLDIDEVKELVGGRVNADWIQNDCVIKLSYSLNESGWQIPRSAAGLSVVSGADRRWYAYRVAELRRHFRRVVGAPTIERRGGDVTPFLGRKGIVVFEVSAFQTATGHVDLWNGEEAAGADYFAMADKVQLWELASTYDGPNPQPGDEMPGDEAEDVPFDGWIESY